MTATQSMLLPLILRADELFVNRYMVHEAVTSNVMLMS